MRATGPIPVLLATALLSPLAASGLPAPTTAAGSEAQPPAQRTPRRLYRIVGCRSRPRIAYLHGPARREVAIGFDDGPAPDTGAFVRMLERNRARATFFMIGRQLSAAYRSVLLRELRDGDVLGDHSFTHPLLTSTGGVRSELQRTLLAIRALSGYTPCVFRPPYGAYDREVVRVAGSLGLATVLWNVDPTDWAQPPVTAIVERVLAQVRPGSIVVSHDGGGPRGNTLAAYPRIIAALRARGYRIVTIPELLGFRPVYAPCRARCDSLGLPLAKLPAGAIVQPHPPSARAALRRRNAPFTSSRRAAKLRRMRPPAARRRDSHSSIERP